MGSERRGRAVHGRLEVNPSGEEPTDRPKQKLKSFEIRKRLVLAITSLTDMSRLMGRCAARAG